MKKNSIISSFIILGIILLTLGIMTSYLIISLKNTPSSEIDKFDYGVAYVLLLAIFLITNVTTVVLVLLVIAIMLFNCFRGQNIQKGIYVLYNVIFSLYLTSCISIFVASFNSITNNYPITIVALGLIIIISFPLVKNTKYLINQKIEN